MERLVESVSLRGLAGGVLVGAIAVGVMALGSYRPGPAVAVAIGVLAVVFGLGGLEPFGETLAYHVLQAAAFALWGVTVLVAGEATVLAVAFVLLGAIGVANYGWQAVEHGPWRRVGE